MVMNFKACLSFRDNIPGLSTQGSAARDNFISRKQVYNWWDVCILDTMLLWSIQTIYTFLLFFYFLNYQRVLILNSPFQKERESHEVLLWHTCLIFAAFINRSVVQGWAGSLCISWELLYNWNEMESDRNFSRGRTECSDLVSRGTPHQKGSPQPWNYIFGSRPDFWFQEWFHDSMEVP